MKSELWKAVIHAIEASIPEYDEVNEKVSLGRAMKAREYAADQLKLEEGMIVLDAGIGPGTMSKVLLSKTTGLTVVGLDASTKLLNAARERFKSLSGGEVHLVRGAFEALPVRDGSVSEIVSAYAFRDSRNRNTAIDEFHRVLVSGGCFLVVDLGKPDKALKRSIITIYVKYLIPLIARFSKSERIRGNPWGMIFPTYQSLGPNRELVQSLRRRFEDVRMWEFSLGGVIVVLAQSPALASAS
jgi:demethylmenaquinone methyltransferase/2-methoxy-6-polyprenyl-1,4-benzoquinol methylase